MQEGVYSGQVISAKWTEYTDRDTDITIPVLSIGVEITDGDEKKRVFPSLFIDSTIIDRGVQAGKTRVQDALETLETYGLDVNVDDPADNDPTGWPDQLVGIEIPVYCKEKDGKIKAYLNRLGKPAIEPARVKELWTAVAGSAPKQRQAPQVDTGIGDDDDDLPF